ncbi:hypothetical protein E2C01_052713 [Portunus trituberculatus]|uniref:Uncharacterized protein n=1 Tax=Portunus trituberculatus TaxID=210409 RepID=A0A5B7GMK7_PORTR|nr:hypothetical protein [Portunus trituberculatus]
MDLRLIPEFDGTSHAVVEWLEKLELVYKLQGITELHTLVLLRLTAGAFSVYQQLTSSEKEEYETVLVDDSLGVGLTTYVSCLSHHAVASTSSEGDAVCCLSYNQPNRYARDFLAGYGARRGRRGSVHCYNCEQ